jgi:hypothetical protein
MFISNLNQQQLYPAHLVLPQQQGNARKAKVLKSEPISVLGALQVQPNPAETFTQVNIPKLDEASRLELFDLNGHLLKSVLIPAGTLTFNLEIAEFASGLYALKLSGNKYHGVIKLLVK